MAGLGLSASRLFLRLDDALQQALCFAWLLLRLLHAEGGSGFHEESLFRVVGSFRIAPFKLVWRHRRTAPLLSLP